MGLPVCLVPSKLKYTPDAEALGEISRIYGFQEIRHKNKETVGWIKFMDPIPFLLFGRDLGASHVFVGHPSVSPQHAVAFWDRRTGLCMIQDLESESGTKLNGKSLSHLEPVVLQPKDEIVMGNSAHHYIFDYLPLEYRDEEPPNTQPPSMDARTEASGLPPPARRLSNDSPPPVGPGAFSRSPIGSEVRGRPGMSARMLGPPRRSGPLAELPSGRDREHPRPDDLSYDRGRGMDSRWHDRPMGRGEPMDDDPRRMPPLNPDRYPPGRDPSSPPPRPPRDPMDDRYAPMHDPREHDRRPFRPDDYENRRPVHPPRGFRPPPDGHPEEFRRPPPPDMDYGRQRRPMREYDDRGPPPEDYRGRGGRDYEYDRRGGDVYRPRGGGRSGYSGGDSGRHRPRQNDGY
ncbi:FHA domain containing protein [Gracilaria domingensis]|nr:FHA domain containing protein [Gracilaria domingensis]